ncbi:cyanophycin synthetase [Deinococcus peraridilitoris]|uniref:Cyanophycin synthetase n=1 Tax=Deinococcus peraridilitoris (strain DSM 19664 / LMG 22246 / CIP 109416 / KR-200) TaxID=937777 RepID=K9ZYV3_DEIPD|nr:cyanophycin synthetase [Deinococcus peraridilitoris]AFZ66833.1 cyanophycin synthetase [Deinococcus peraridilitoris DSM 19664]
MITNTSAAQAADESSISFSGLRVTEKQVYRGPNIYGYEPMIRFQLDLGELEHHPSNALPDFSERLVELLPSLHNHGCSYREPGGFIRRLHEGTWLGHVTEHVALELQTLAGTRVTYGKTRSVKGQTGVYNVLYTYKEERVGLLAGLVALRLVNSLLPGEMQGVVGLSKLMPREVDSRIDLDVAFDFEAELGELRRLVKRYAFGPTTRSLVEEAERRGIPFLRLDDASLVQMGYGKYQRQIRASITSNTSFIATQTASDKALTKKLLDRAGLPVPQGAVVRSAEDAIRAAQRVGYPVVTKPLDGNHGRGVSLNLNSPEEVRWGFEQARAHSRDVVVEQQYQGNDHRVLVINGEVVAVAERIPAHVVGDGRRTIQELVEEINQDPRRGDGHENVMTRIVIDQHVIDLLARSGLSPVSVPLEGQTVFLRDTANLSTGGTAVDRTNVAHPMNITIARRAAQVIGLDVAGIDMISPDISRSLYESGGGIVEVNAAPGFRMHLEPSQGTPRNVASAVIDSLFPKGTPCRMPIIAITGTNGKTTTTRMVAHILRHAGKVVGFTTSNGIYVDGELVMSGDTTGPRSAKVILGDPTVDVAVLETARGGILREGLAFERCDVGAVLNIQPDHLGLKGIETVEDLAWVKSLIVEVVTDTGTSVLNADDPLTLKMQKKARGKVILFSMQGGRDAPAHLARHIAQGGTALVREPTLMGDELVLYDSGQRLPIIRAREIPATLGGFAQVNIANALAAAAIAFAQDVSLPVLRTALSSFSTSFEQNPGRLNLYDGHPFRVLLDYAHNPDGLGYLGELVKHLRPERGRVIGVIGVAGDRRDQDIRLMGELAATAFDEIIVREDELRRGRKVGQGARLVAEGALSTGFDASRLQTILSEPEAVQAALRSARAGDLVVLLATEVEGVWQQMRDFDSTQTPPRIYDDTLRQASSTSEVPQQEHRA